MNAFIEIDLSEFASKFSELDIENVSCLHGKKEQLAYFFLIGKKKDYRTVEEFMAVSYKYLLVEFEYNKKFYESLENTFKLDLLESKNRLYKTDWKRILEDNKEKFHEEDIFKIKAFLKSVSYEAQYGYKNSEYIFKDNSHYFYLTYY